ncbi:MAG: hypothetical protein AWM53_01187 [Candidatus Dichloromethanomonas elyunquensis]|nr:MAG: hypothetical protein AWM53_01187 [Candidatus Dichloromethanomonas elyunquensis]
MKTSGHLLLYISENEDFELWRVLSQISPDDRTAFVKSALKKALLQGNEARNTSSRWAKQNNVFRMDKSITENPIDELALEELGYSSLTSSEDKMIKSLKAFSAERTTPKDIFDTGSLQKDAAEEDRLEDFHIDDLLQTPSSSNKSTLPGLDFLLNNVIGEENDEKVIEFILSNKPAGGENS